MIFYKPLKSFLEEYNDKNVDNKYKTVAVGKYGIRTRESIYSKELAKDYSKNKLIYKNTLTVGMGSKQIDIGILSDDHVFSVSPAYHTFKISNINPDYLRYCLQARNPDMFIRYVKRGSRQGKAIDLKRWLTYEIPIHEKLVQKEIVKTLDVVKDLLEAYKEELDRYDELVKSRFVEMFGDPKYNKNNLVKVEEIGVLTSGGTPTRAKLEYFEGRVRWYSAGELNSLYLPDSLEHISETALQQSSAKLFNKGTLMIGMYDTAALKMGILTEDSSSNQACANLNPKQGYNVVWLYYLFDIMKPIFLQERQGVRQKNLSLSKIKNFEVPFAPFTLQNEFADFVAQVDKSKVAIQAALDKTQLLFDSLMQEYFG